METGASPWRINHALSTATDHASTPPDVGALQRHLVAIGNLPQDVLTHEDSFPLPDKLVHKAVRDYADGAQSRAGRCKTLAIILSHADEARAPVLRKG